MTDVGYFALTNASTRSSAFSPFSILVVMARGRPKVLDDNYDAGKLNKKGPAVSVARITNKQASKAVEPTKETLLMC